MCKLHVMVTMFHKCSDTGCYNHHYYCHLVYLACCGIYSELDSLAKIIISTHHCCKQFSYSLYNYVFTLRSEDLMWTVFNSSVGDYHLEY